MDKKYWTTQDGRILYPKDFTDDHLLNTISFIEKNAPSYKWEYELSLYTLPEPSGDAASLYFEQSLLRIERMPVDSWLNCYCGIYSLLKKEAKRRKLLH